MEEICDELDEALEKIDTGNLEKSKMGSIGL